MILNDYFKINFHISKTCCTIVLLKKTKQIKEMEKLVKVLLAETKILKDEYLEKIGEWAKQDFERYVEMASYKEVEWCKHLGLEPQLVNVGTPSEFLSFPKGFWNTKESRTYDNLKNKAYRIKRMGSDAYVEKCLKDGESHYESSINKLANRIVKKGLNESKLVVETARVGVNIETILTDGEKSVKAWTIIASGAVQKPHYRYLVK